MPARHALVHHAPEHFGEPVVSRCENAEYGCDAHNQVEMTDHEIRVVQLNIENRLRQERAADSAGNEKGHKAESEQHGRREADVPAPYSAEPVEGFDGRWHADSHGHYGK